MKVQVTPETRRHPRVVEHLRDWQYLERSFHRLLCAYGRHLADWEDKVALSRHVWEQAESVRRIRERLAEFPGTAHNADFLPGKVLEDLANTVLLAPSSEDAFTGIYQLLLDAMVKSYVNYVEDAHPVHDAPTIMLVQDLVRLKEQQRLWLRDYRRRRPHEADADYVQAFDAALGRANQLLDPCGEAEDGPAHPVGVRTGFQLLARAKHPRGTEPTSDWDAYAAGDFAVDLEARRLFWCYGYMLEMNLAEDQLRWLWAAYDMPWEFQHDVSRHMWDESRHGDSGRSRLLDFGIDLSDVGYRYYDDTFPPNFEGPNESHLTAPELTPRELYDEIFRIGMIAETGHFTVKREAYDDFKKAGDLESAEMVLFDIIDETSHVQYAHRWLPELARRAGIDPEAFKQEGAAEREKHAAAAQERQLEARKRPRSMEVPAYAQYQTLLKRMREAKPLAPIGDLARTPLPM